MRWRERRLDKVAQLRAVRDAVAQVVVTLDVLLKENAIDPVVDQPELKRQVIAQIADDLRLC